MISRLGLLAHRRCEAQSLLPLASGRRDGRIEADAAGPQALRWQAAEQQQGVGPALRASGGIEADGVPTEAVKQQMERVTPGGASDASVVGHGGGRKAPLGQL